MQEHLFTKQVNKKMHSTYFFTNLGNPYSLDRLDMFVQDNFS